GMLRRGERAEGRGKGGREKGELSSVFSLDTAGLSRKPGNQEAGVDSAKETGFVVEAELVESWLRGF
ncbi:MAG: hypothetical protein ACREH8_16210, partial [Opitutaceae bacterium]